MHPRPTILVVAADDETRADLETVVEATGLRARPAPTERDALGAARGAELAVVDDRVTADPLGMVERLIDSAGVRILLVTGASPGERAAAIEAGCDDALSRPIDAGELRARLGNLLARHADEERLEQAADEERELHEIKRVLAALLVHDLRNPISAIQGNVDLVRELLDDDDEMVADSLRDIKELSVKALSLVTSLLDVEELEEGLLRAHREPASVRACVDQALLPHRRTIRARGLEVHVDISSDLTFSFDSEMCSRMIENLLDNAVRYAPRRGQVAVSARVEGGELVIWVGNDGPPIPASERPKIFDRYYRIEARRDGARANRGLGLYFCRLVAEAHDGSIGVTEAAELPAVFEVRIPGS